jgi:hypothetical protein
LPSQRCPRGVPSAFRFFVFFRLLNKQRQSCASACGVFSFSGMERLLNGLAKTIRGRKKYERNEKLKIENHIKTIVAILTALVILCSAIMIPSLAFRNGYTSHGADYAIFEGTAGNDYYSTMQYSYMVNQWATQNGQYSARYPNATYYTAGKSLRVGLTEYGEMATPLNAGIAYGANNAEWNITESWSSSNPAIPPQLWIQGWTFYLNYTRQGVLRAVEAWAMFSNTSVTEGARSAYSWYGDHNPADTGSGLTACTLIPTDVRILYDSARLVIGRTGVVIHDTFYNEDVAEVFVTINFFKDTKYAIVYKDVKILLEPKILDLINDFAFSERYELDIASYMNPSNAAYIHYYHNSNTTVYQNPLTGASSYDTLQAYDVNDNYIFFAGYWPNTTEYTVYYPLLPNPAGNNMDLLPFGTAIADMPGPSGTPVSPKEPSTPWVIAQWRYNNTAYPDLTTWLAKGAQRQFRAVEVVGMTDFNSDPHPARDFNETGTANQLDTEVLYTLWQVFNPMDLNSLKTTPNPFMWIGLGQSSATTDSADSSLLGGAYGANVTALGLFDRNDTMFPWSGGITMQGSIPYGLDGFTGNYLETFSNSGKGTGSDTTTYKRTGLLDFVPGTSEEIETGETFPPQPVAGGWDTVDGDGWFPSIDPLTQAWSYSPWVQSSTWADNSIVSYHPNGILSLGGPKANGLTRYFNDFGFAIAREGTSGSYYAELELGGVSGPAPTSDPNLGTLDYFPVSTWNVGTMTFGYGANYAVVSLVKDVNGTRGLSIYGWNGRDTYWAATWASQYLLGNTTLSSAGLPAGTVALILQMTYGGPNMEPSAFTVVKALGTITEFGTDAYYTFSGGVGAFDQNHSLTWSGLVSPTPLPIIGPVHVWWYQKLPTISTATVDFN